LKQMGARLEGAIGASAIGRVSADHFVALLHPVKGRSEAARRVDQLLRACFEAPYLVGGNELRLAAKVGIALFPGDGDDAEALLKHAEAALRKGKEGGERITFYTQDLTEQTATALTLENKLRQALRKEEFVLY